MGIAYALKVIIYISVATIAAIVGSRRMRRLRKQVAAQGVALGEWAKRQGWRFAEGSDPEIATLVDEMQALLAEEGRREVSGVAIGQNGAGRIIVAQTFRSDISGARSGTEAPLPWSGPNAAAESGPSVDVAFDTQHEASPTLVVVIASGRIKPEPGEAPPTAAQEEALTGLPAGARLRVMPGKLLLRTPRFFTPAIAEDLLKRLAILDGSQAGGRGPNR